MITHVYCRQIVMVALIGAGLASVGSFALVYAGLIPDTFKPGTDEIDEIACERQLTDCCCCNDPGVTRRCPEWSTDEVIKLLVLDLKLTGTVSLVSIVYLIGAIVVALLLRISLKNYKTEYV
jgi:hypothetical protein